MHRRQRKSRLLAAVLGSVGLVLASLALEGVAGAATQDLREIDVAALHLSGDRNIYVVGGLTSSGTITAELLSCSSQQACSRRGWTSLGSGFASVVVGDIGDHYHASSHPEVVVVGRRTDGATWYKRGTCDSQACTWGSWQNLGGRVVSVTGSDETSCVILGARSASNKVYDASICGESVRGWSYTGGKLQQVGIRGSTLFGPSGSGALWEQALRPDPSSPVGVSLKWVGRGGRITMPVRNPWDRQMMCGLAGGARNLWCYAHESSDNPKWEKRGGSYRKLDDGQTIGIVNSWSAWLYDSAAHAPLGGRLNQLALAEPNSLSAPTIVVGISGSYNAWYQQIQGPEGGWQSLSGGWKPL